jgi:hypothetical protein
MAKPTVYIETTIIGYLAMRMSAALRTAADQVTTREWWDNHRDKYEVLVSQLLLKSAPKAIRRRPKSGKSSFPASPSSNLRRR